MDAPQLFFSYSRQDSEFVVKLARDLKSHGIDAWLDILNIPAGVHWDYEIEKALIGCQSMVIVLSPQSVASQNVLDEISYALGKQKKIIPILFQQCEIPFRINRLQYIDFTKDYVSALNKLIILLKGNDKMKEQENLIKKDPDINPKPSQTPFTSKIKWQSKGFRLFILFIAVALLSFFVYKVYDSSHYSYDKTNPILSAIYEKAQTCKMGKTLQQNIHATNSNTGFYLPFEKGNVYYFQSKGTFALWGPVLHMWESNQYEKGFLGYPKSDIIETKNKDGENGEYAIFEGGRVYYSDSTNVHYVRGDIDLKYQHSNAERGVLGYPTSNEQNITGYSDGYTLESVFENGRIVWRNNAPQGKPNDTVIVLKSEEPFFQKH